MPVFPMRLAAAFVLSAIIAGCGSDFPTTPVTGMCIDANGEPVTAGKLVFHPQTEGAPPSITDLGEGGKFELSTARGKGAAVAPHTVLYVPPETVENADGTAGDPSKFRAWKVPDGFTIDIGPDTDEIEIKLVKK